MSDVCHILCSRRPFIPSQMLVIGSGYRIETQVNQIMKTKPVSVDESSTHINSGSTCSESPGQWIIVNHFKEIYNFMEKLVQCVVFNLKRLNSRTICGNVFKWDHTGLCWPSVSTAVSQSVPTRGCLAIQVPCSINNNNNFSDSADCVVSRFSREISSTSKKKSFNWCWSNIRRTRR
jgi:hypothetical protein